MSKIAFALAILVVMLTIVLSKEVAVAQSRPADRANTFVCPNGTHSTNCSGSAQDPSWSVCRKDYYRLCAGVQQGGGRIINCLAAQKNKLSHGCLKRVESAGR
jgi:hypothetical protein